MRVGAIVSGVWDVVVVIIGITDITSAIVVGVCLAVVEGAHAVVGLVGIPIAILVEGAV
jgi:hypothetical protein